MFDSANDRPSGVRPGEKAVTVLANGKPTAYSMEIENAGEALSVFGTEEDVPASGGGGLMTSRTLGPIQISRSALQLAQTTVPSGENESSGDAQLQQETPGRFGSPAAGRETNSDENKTVAAGSSRSEDADSAASTSFSRSKAKDHYDRRTETCKTRKKFLNTGLDQAKQARDHLHDVKVRLSPSNRADKESKEAAEALDEEVAQPPEVVYGKYVALVPAGYHNTEAAGEESDEVGKAPDPKTLHTATRPRIISPVPFVLITTVDLPSNVTGE